MSAIFVNGKYLVVNGVTGNAGDKNGIITIIVPVVFPNISTAIGTNWQMVAEAVGIAGVSCVDRPMHELPHGEYQVDYTLKGSSGNLPEKPVAGGDGTTIKVTGSMSDDPIQGHPHFETLKKKYNYDPATEKFRETLPTDVTSATRALSKTNAQKNHNPLFGAESYLNVGATLEITYAAKVVPLEAWKGIGTPVKNPPGSEGLITNVGSGRDWLKLAPSVDQQGSVFKITARYMLSGPDGWNTDVYYADQLAL